MKVEIVATMKLAEHAIENRVCVEVSDANDIRQVMNHAIDALRACPVACKTEVKA